MHFTAPSVAILALAAGVSAGVATTKQHEPAPHNLKSVSQQHATGATGITTGAHPIITGTPNNGTHGGNNSTVIVTSTAPCFTCQSSSTIPVNVPGKTPGASSSGVAAGSSGVAAGSSGVAGGAGAGATSAPGASSGAGAGAGAGAGSESGAGNTPASPSATGFTPSSPGSKVTVPQVGAVGAVLAYGAAIFLA